MAAYRSIVNTQYKFSMKLFSRIAIAALAGALAFSSCGEEKYTKYQCPMKCEQEKTYDKPGTCPVCGMKLKGIK